MNTDTSTNTKLETNTEAGRERRMGPTITLGICLAAGLAAGIALLRPGTTSASGDTAAADGVSQTASADGSTAGYGSNDGADGQGSAAPAQAPAAPAAVTIADFAFGDPVTVAAGTAINVTNQDGVPHTLTAQDAAFDTGTIAGNGTAGLTAPTAPGTYRFFCSIHPSMQGTLTVTS